VSALVSSLHAPVHPARAARATPFAGRGWRTFLVASALLVPFVLPAGPAQIALLDAISLIALALFYGSAVARRVPVVLPFAVPVLFIGAGSLLAVTNAVSVQASALSIAQDLYLYLWFVALVAVMSRQGDLFGFRVAWLLAADASALVVLGQAIAGGAFPAHFLAAEGFRPAGTFYGANMCADYLALSVFVALSLWRRAPRPVVAASIALLVVGILVTKSNGTLIALALGLAVTVLTAVLRSDGRRVRALGGVALLVAGVLFTGWLATEWNLARSVGSAGKASIFGRMEKSSTGRKEIWSQLVARLERHPLGIGPGNSSLQPVPIGHRERPGMSFQGKEAHSDYVAYATERGPIGLVGHLLWVLAGIVLVLGGPARRRDVDWLRAVFAGGLVASAVHSTVIEKLHFRHYWLFLALACALAAGERFRPAGEEAR
jgi:O-antigen ligase